MGPDLLSSMSAPELPNLSIASSQDTNRFLSLSSSGKSTETTVLQIITEEPVLQPQKDPIASRSGESNPRSENSTDAETT